jgi:aminotransferase
LQQAGAAALAWGPEYYSDLAAAYLKRRDHMVDSLQNAGFHCFVPRGAYYVMTDISNFHVNDDVAFCTDLIDNVGLAAVPGSSFYSQSGGGKSQVRFCFCKKYETLEEARRQLQKL